MLLCLQDHYRNQMDNKENLGLTIGVDKNIDKSFSNTIRMSIKPSNICSMVTELDAQKEYLAKLKIQRQKTEKLHAEYLKLKKQKQKMKEQSQSELNSTKSKLIECQAQVNKKIEDVRFLERQIQKFKVQIDKINRQKTENINSLKFSFEKSFTQMKLSMESLAENLESKNRQINSLKKSHSLKVTDLQNQKAQLENASRNMQQKLKQSQQKRRQSENLVTILTKKLEDSNSQASRNRNESQQKNKQISTLKSTNQRLQLDQQVSSRKLNDLQLQLHQSEQKMLEMQRQKQKYRSKLEQSEQRSRDWKQEVQKIKKECSQLKCLYSVLKDQNMRKQETIKQYSSKMMNRQDEEIWRQRLSQKENENDQLLDIIRNLKEENDQLLSFIKQKQLLQRQRRSLVEYQMEEICKFENLLKDVK